MSDFQLSKKRIYAGIWEGVLTSQSSSSEPPELIVTHLEREIPAVSIQRSGGRNNSWQVRIAIPPESLHDGVQVYTITDKASGETLDSFTILTGEPLDDDIRAEVELLRAELDLLKQAFRRHCLET